MDSSPADTTTTPTTATSKPFRFFDLPGELCNAIYAEVLTYNGIQPTFTSPRSHPPSTKKPTTMTGTTTLNALTPRPTPHPHRRPHPQRPPLLPPWRPTHHPRPTPQGLPKNRFLVGEGEEKVCFDGWVEKRGLRDFVRKVEGKPAVELPDWVAQYWELRESGRSGPLGDDWYEY
ncbi:MAG: hypothetical protein L6R37_005487 [Teloschistes peruensis]|nr:MAG: hypothetical protein L6R37_005487 [Teloschistes peruensis]